MSPELVSVRTAFGVYLPNPTRLKRHCSEDRRELLHARFFRFTSVMVTPSQQDLTCKRYFP